MKICEVCNARNDLQEDFFMCGRCGKDTCRLCISEYPLGDLIICKKCNDEWIKLMEKNNFPRK